MSGTVTKDTVSAIAKGISVAVHGYYHAEAIATGNVHWLFFWVPI